MIITMFVVCALGLLLTCLLGPKKDIVHAARAKYLPGMRQPRWPLWSSTLFFNRNGQRLKRKGMYFAEAYGSSMTSVDIEDGDIVGGTKVSNLCSEEKSKLLNPGAIVVVEGEAVISRCKKRLRRVARVEGENVFFCDDRDGKSHRVRPLDEIVAIIDRKFI